VSHLLTTVDLNDADDDGPAASRMSVRAQHEAVLADGQRVLLLDDRGWGGGSVPGIPDIWSRQTLEEMKDTARVVVGPDEPVEGGSWAEEEAEHWDWLSRILRGHGIEVSGAELKALRHDVELSDRVLARIGYGRNDAP